MTNLHPINLLIWQFHAIKNPKDNFEDFLPPMLVKSVAVRFHYFKHDSKSTKNQEKKQMKKSWFQPNSSYIQLNTDKSS